MSSGEKISHNRRTSLVSAFFVANAFIWYFLAYGIIENMVSNIKNNFLLVQTIWVAHFGTLAISFIVGTLLVKKVERSQLFKFWTLLGVLSPFVFLAFNYAQVPVTFLVSILFAASLGLGITNCMQYFTQTTNAGSRGRYSGLIMLVSGVGVALSGLLVQGILLPVILLVAWRSIALLAVSIVKPFNKGKRKKREAFHIVRCSVKGLLSCI